MFCMYIYIYVEREREREICATCDILNFIPISCLSGGGATGLWICAGRFLEVLGPFDTKRILSLYQKFPETPLVIELV